jgi:molecular chaperone Hsp33
MLVSLGREEVDSIIDELGTVTVTCDFCGRSYGLDAGDVEQLFAAGTMPPSTLTTRH